MSTPDRIAAYLATVNTAALQRSGVSTVALVVFNFDNRAVSPGRVCFSASFPTSGPKPVAVWDNNGNPIPSRIVAQSINTQALGLPPGCVLWTLTLEFALLDGLPTYTARAYAASYESVMIPDSEVLLDSLPLLSLPVHETDCHTGNQGTEFAL